jgi:hypothetical protein
MRVTAAKIALAVFWMIVSIAGHESACDVQGQAAEIIARMTAAKCETQTPL